MTNTSTKRALFSSVVSLFLCFVMLMGTTFAWFTDVATSEGNVIQAGTLDVQLFKHDATGSTEITDSSDPIFGKADSANANANTADTLWEPGKTQTVYLSIKNNGSLDLKYTVAIEVTNIENNLNEVLYYVITPDATVASPVTKDTLPSNWDTCNKVEAGINFASDGDTALQAGGEHFFALSVHMDEDAGNEYQEGNVTFNIKVLAGQLSSEEDSFGADYDLDAIYPEGFVTLPADDEFPVAGYEIPYYLDGEKIGTITVPAAALPEGSRNLVYTVTPTQVDSNFSVTAAQTYAFDIEVIGLVENNTAPILTEVRIDKDIEGEIAVYHNNTERIEIDSYNPNTGMVKFYTTSYSPFVVVVDEEVEITDFTVPQAVVTYLPEYVNNANIEWGQYDNWSPVSGVEANLDVCFSFTSLHDTDTVTQCLYKDWYVDFVVSLDSPLGENQIFLGGNYGSFGWVGFHNRDLTLDANYEVPLLGSVTGGDERVSGWRYEDIVNYVGGFICGVGNVGDNLDGATVTVVLRLTNPENLNDQIDVSTITYTFDGDTYTINGEEFTKTTVNE